MFWDSAKRLNAKGLQLEESGDRVEAERFYTKALEKDPSWSVAWYNLGLPGRSR